MCQQSVIDILLDKFKFLTLFKAKKYAKERKMVTWFLIKQNTGRLKITTENKVHSEKKTLRF